jgi:hypothetical protein
MNKAGAMLQTSHAHYFERTRAPVVPYISMMAAGVCFLSLAVFAQEG